MTENTIKSENTVKSKRIRNVWNILETEKTGNTENSYYRVDIEDMKGRKDRGNREDS